MAKNSPVGWNVLRKGKKICSFNKKTGSCAHKLTQNMTSLIRDAASVLLMPILHPNFAMNFGTHSLSLCLSKARPSFLGSHVSLGHCILKQKKNAIEMSNICIFMF